jgi:hypothetical protein
VSFVISFGIALAVTYTVLHRMQRRAQPVRFLEPYEWAAARRQGLI